MLKVGNKIRTIVTPQMLKDFPEAKGVAGIVESKPYNIGDELVVEVVYEGSKEKSIVPVNEVEKIKESKFSVGSHEYLEELKVDAHEYFRGLNIQPTAEDIEDNMAEALADEAGISYEHAMKKIMNFYKDYESNMSDEIRYKIGELTVPEENQLKIARDTLKMTDAGAKAMGGMTREEAQTIIKRFTGKEIEEALEQKDSPYLQRELTELIKDAEQNGEKDLAAFYDYLLGRLDQSFPDGDVTREDVDDLLNEPRGREVGRDIPIWVVDDLFEAVEVKQMYKKAGIKAPDGKGIHTKKFHEIATAIKKDNPDYPMDRCYSIAMGKLGKEKAVKKDHRSESEETNIRDKHNLKEGDVILVRTHEKGAPIGEDGTGEIESFEYEGKFGDDGIVVKVDNRSLYGTLEEVEDVPVVMIQTENESKEEEIKQEPEALAKPLSDIEKEEYKKFVDEVTTKIKKKDYVRVMTIDTCVLYCGTVTDISKKGIKIDSDNLIVGKATIDMLNIANIEKVENSEVAVRVERLTVQSSEEDV